MLTPEQRKMIATDQVCQESMHRMDELLNLGRKQSILKMEVWSTCLVGRTDAEIRDAIIIRIQEALASFQAISSMTGLMLDDERGDLANYNAIVLRRFMQNRFTTRELLEFVTNLNKEHDDHGNG